MRKIERARCDLRDELRQTLAKANQLQIQLDRIEKKKQELVDRELQNVEELEAEEQRLAAIDDCPFNVDAENFSLPEGFEWPLVPAAAYGTPSAGPDSSSGS
ncbi:hypothetical protein N7G274_009648 [Stereocaulon virgatum]|uniref:Uncharacterized protein n=1 Tax=Stereocaulon virgatum TaxID=373712 RepID=A0ABR4A315_9LECA